MKFIKRTNDGNLIKQLIDPEYDNLVYDGSPSLEKYVPKGVWFILYEDKLVAGLINLESINNVLWIAHVVIYEEFRGNNSFEWGRQVARYMSQHLGAKQFLVLTPYVQAKRYAEKVGFKNETIITKSIRKNGKLLDQYLLTLGEHQW